MLLGDANPAVVGDEIRGATTAQAQLAVTELARLQGPLLGDSTLAETPWLNRDAPINQALITALYAGFVDRYGDRIAPQHRLVCERLVGAFDEYLAEEAADGRIHGLVHGDYRLDNMLFGADGADRPLTVVDWQTVTWGPAMTDLAYFLGCALPAADRREHYDALLDDYHRALGPGAPISPRRCPRGRAPAELLRRDDGHRVVDAGGTHRPRRRDVHDDAATALRACARHRRAGDPARADRRSSRCARRPTTRRPTSPPTSRSGMKAGMPTSPMPHRDSAAGCDSV